MEAALKMILARFYPVERDLAVPKYHGRIPVILVMGNDDGGLQANYHAGLRELAEAYPDELEGVDGWNHMTTLRFRGLDPAKAFAAALGRRGLDVSAQTYKADCPPVVLTKLPLIADRPMIDWVLERMNEAMQALRPSRKPERIEP